MKTLVILCLCMVLPATVLSTCVDKHASCSYWAFRGECSINPNYMSQNCCLSCQTVENLQNKESCTNTKSKCSSWANSGECCKNPVYMLDYCCASCSAKGYNIPS